MISRIFGKLISKTTTEIEVECGGICYLAFVSVNTLDKLPEIGDHVELFTLLIPKDDELQLYAYSEVVERDAFKMLISIPGIGPKTAIGILSSLKVWELQEFILGGNSSTLQKLPGIGRKTAERIILELRDKINRLVVSDKRIIAEPQNLIKQEALSALITLGYSRIIAEKAIKKVILENSENKLSAETLIRKALKFTML